MVLFIVLYISITIISSIYFANRVIDDECYMFFTPKYIYDWSYMNMFGCTLITILYFIFVPYYCIIATLCWIIYKICHIGRKDN